MDKDTLRKAQGLIGEAITLVQAVRDGEQDKLDEAEEEADTTPLEDGISYLNVTLGSLEDADGDIENAIAIGGSVG